MILSICVFQMRKFVEVRRSDTKLVTFSVTGYGYSGWVRAEVFDVIDTLKKKKKKSEIVSLYLTVNL